MSQSTVTHLFDRESVRSDSDVLVVQVDMPSFFTCDDWSEFRELVASTGSMIYDEITVRRHKPDSRYFIGSGKAEALKEMVTESGIKLALFNCELSPSQERNLERIAECRVVDRTGLILDIFSRRAKTHEGCLQVELAQLQHLATRLVRGWSHLERQKGGIGLRGPGETQLETDRRLLQKRIKTLEKRLQSVKNQRHMNRQSRKKNSVPQVALVGYTNAGKSSLFNALAKAEIYVEDQLFATLDPTLRKIDLPNRQGMVLADTVGFIRHLPHDLVAAFRATLEEVKVADLLLHVVDVASADRQASMEAVNQVLELIGADQIPQLIIYNKLDLLSDTPVQLETDEAGLPKRVWISVKEDMGLDVLKGAVITLLGREMQRVLIQIPSEQAKLRSLCYRLGDVVSDQFDQASDSWQVALRLSLENHAWLCKYYPSILIKQ